ncbi:MAG: hypothetical protein JW873_03540 [Candidatus Saganbacteria bacterium]|nr:hypothetical protein [Candidatus Saganbacteria bacterium]
MTILKVLQPVTFGHRVAEEETDILAKYFVETDQWQQLFSDKVDIIYGPKGSGKSALYSLLIGRKTELFDRGILAAVAENPRGTTAFQSLVINPPASETEFIALWKLYIACLVSATLDEYGISGAQAKELRDRLQESGLRPKEKNLQRVLLSAFDYVKRLLRPESVEGGLTLDPAGQIPSITAKITFSEPSATQIKEGAVSVDHLLELGDSALASVKYKLWVLLDRLDVAFLESPELEQNALRALFHVYLDFLSLSNFRLKIFLRTDIWQRITSVGFREASHITRQLTIEWNRSTILNLIVRRAVQNESILDYYHEKKEAVLATTESQEKFFYRLFPDQVEVGSRKSNTLDWMLSRTWDGSRQAAPREIIHLLNALRDAQVRQLEIGDSEPEGGRLFSRQVFKEALSEVSKTRLGQTLYAEYPDFRNQIEKLRGKKTEYSAQSLAKIWKSAPEATMELARNLCTIGFFEQRGEQDDPKFWVPILYRDSLDLVQGASE